MVMKWAKRCCNRTLQASTLPAIVVMWMGAWRLLDRIPGGTSEPKTLTLTICGIVLMIATNTFFSSGFMGTVDSGELLHLAQIMRSGTIGTRDHIRFYALTFAAVIGSVAFWLGAYSACVELGSGAENPLVLEIHSALLGTIFVTWMIHLEAAEETVAAEQEHEILKRAMHDTATGGRTAGGILATLTPMSRSAMYVMAGVCNIAQVFLWWGIENLMYEIAPDGKWSGVGLSVLALVGLKFVDRLEANLFLEDDDAEKEPAVGEAARGSAPWLLPLCLPSHIYIWIAHTVELICIVGLWTGIEWYFWDSTLIPASILRDIVYVIGGALILLATGALASTAGVISPMVVCSNYLRHHNMDQIAPLLMHDMQDYHLNTPGSQDISINTPDPLNGNSNRGMFNERGQPLVTTASLPQIPSTHETLFRRRTAPSRHNSSSQANGGNSGSPPPRPGDEESGGEDKATAGLTGSDREYSSGSRHGRSKLMQEGDVMSPITGDTEEYKLFSSATKQRRASLEPEMSPRRASDVNLQSSGLTTALL